ncbi:MAG: hypothetical protein U5L02_08515 [Rheinheimera sp.]|nr:hypothetical protein [Rheinheimera sp.]
MFKRNALSLAVALACAFPAIAQDVPADANQTNAKQSAASNSAATAKNPSNDTTLEVISVTATKRKTKLMETSSGYFSPE